MLERSTLKEMLQSGVYTVTFTKADGTERVMKCTLNSSYLPTVPVVEETTLLTEVPRYENEAILRVWDLEENGWRSFRMDSIKLVY